MLRWFRDFLDQHLLNSHCGTAQSIFRTLQTGRPLGAVSSCLLYDVYVDDLIQPMIDENVSSDNLVVWTSSPKSRANERLHISLSDVKTTSIDALLSYTNEIPMQYEIRKSALKLYQKLIRLLHSNIYGLNLDLAVKKDGFLQAILKEMNGLVIPFHIEYLLHPINPLGSSKLLYHLDLMSL
ncbi:hypothetical protein NPIL_131281 [Nephila pilipes]|uniref:Uncharacterized protein n=1 Tax=Nephila pilipes TaxID=299642 RepID=A0A8X6MQT1_NEPPI|nr:hypothetical protein NPIL_131281 [Nephila pilipes]